jgi:hypothetical protein
MSNKYTRKNAQSKWHWDPPHPSELLLSIKWTIINAEEKELLLIAGRNIN